MQVQSIESLAQQLQQYQAHMAQLQQLMSPFPVPQAPATLSDTPTPEPTPELAPTVANPINDQLTLLGQLYEEFVTLDEGKALAANLTKFARYVQGRVAKTQ